LELANILIRLWRLRRWALVVVPVALLAGFFTAYRVTALFPPAVEKKALEQGAARVQMLIDSPSSPLMDTTGDIGPLAIRAQIYSRLIRSAPVLEEISRATGIPKETIAIQAIAGNLGRVAGTNKPAGPRANQLLDDRKQDILLASAELVGQNPLPVVSIYTQAPTAQEAMALADGAVAGFASFVRKSEARDRIPRWKRVTVRPLGTAAGGLINEGVNPATAILVFLLVFLVGCGAVLAVTNVVEGIRRQRLQEAAEAERLSTEPPPGGFPETAARTDPREIVSAYSQHGPPAHSQLASPGNHTDPLADPLASDGNGGPAGSSAGRGPAEPHAYDPISGSAREGGAPAGSPGNGRGRGVAAFKTWREILRRR
jgi:uncharacterized protein YceK